MKGEDDGRVRTHARTGRPLGDESVVSRVEKLVGRVLRKAQSGPKPKEKRKR